MYDIAVVGSGIGGSLFAALNKNKKTILFEKEKNLGGCASTFKHHGKYYNAGATTLVGYEQGHILKDIFDSIGYVPDIKKSEVAMKILHQDKVVNRTKDKQKFIDELYVAYPNHDHERFWNKIHTIDKEFWKLKGVYFEKYSLKGLLKSGLFFSKLLSIVGLDLFQSAHSFMRQYLGEVSKEYLDFIDAQLLITVQSKSQNISVLSLALGLSYPFHDVYYVNGGMGSLFEGITKDINVHNNEEVLAIRHKQDFFEIDTNKQSYHSKKVVLNSTVYDSKALFEPSTKMANYYKKFQQSDQSAFVLYVDLKANAPLLHHYQVILPKTIPHTTSNSFFVSVSDIDDTKMTKNGNYSVTISTHTSISFWNSLTKKEYEEKKNQTQEAIVAELIMHFDEIEVEDIQRVSSATTHTFHHYINRYNCGGKAINLTQIFSLATCVTPIHNLYHLGDTVFTGQGWPGVALGVDFLQKEMYG